MQPMDTNTTTDTHPYSASATPAEHATIIESVSPDSMPLYEIAGSDPAKTLTQAIEETQRTYGPTRDLTTFGHELANRLTPHLRRRAAAPADTWDNQTAQAPDGVAIITLAAELAGDELDPAVWTWPNYRDEVIRQLDALGVLIDPRPQE